MERGRGVTRESIMPAITPTSLCLLGLSRVHPPEPASLAGRCQILAGTSSLGQTGGYGTRCVCDCGTGDGPTRIYLASSLSMVAWNATGQMSCGINMVREFHLLLILPTGLLSCWATRAFRLNGTMVTALE